MLLPTPIQTKKKEQDYENFIRNEYGKYESTFVILHPFLKINKDSSVKFEYPHWPTKRQIVQNSIKVSWTTIVEKIGLSNINELDQLLAFLHCAERKAEKDKWLKLKRFLDDNQDIVVAQVDHYPEILVDATLRSLKSLGYENILSYTITSGEEVSYYIEGLIMSENELAFKHAGGIISLDKKICFYTDFDNRFTYLSSTRSTIEKIRIEADLEGFYCEENTSTRWSFVDEFENEIDWNSRKFLK